MPTYIPERYLEDGGDRWYGPFAPSLALACEVGGRSYYYKRELTDREYAGTCPDNALVILQFRQVRP